MRFRVKWGTRASRRIGDAGASTNRRRKEARNSARRADVPLIVKESAALQMRGANFPPNFGEVFAVVFVKKFVLILERRLLFEICAPSRRFLSPALGIWKKIDGFLEKGVGKL